VVLGAFGIWATIGAGPGPPRLSFDEARGSAAEVRAQVQRSIREGSLSTSLAPGIADAVADELATAPAVFLAAALDPEDQSWPVVATERVLITNTTRSDLADVRMHVLAPAAEGEIEIAGAKVDGQGVPTRIEGTTLVVGVRHPLPPEGSALVELAWRLRPKELVESANLSPADVLSNPKDSSTFSPQLVRRNLMYLFDWYPRPLPLGDGGWEPLETDPLIADTAGPQGTLMVDLDHPDDWGVAASGARVDQGRADGRAHERYVLAGSRCGGLVLQRNTVERQVRKGDFVATGFGLDRFGPAVADAAANALFAKAVLSEQAGRTRWRQVSVVGLVFAGDAPMFVADDTVFVRQDVLAKGAPAQGPNTEESDYREAAFEGASAEWWGGAAEVDATRHVFLRSGFRRFSAALVWRAVGGDSAAREISSASARRFRDSRLTGTADVPADVASGVYTALPQQAIAGSKTALVELALASARDGDGPAAFDGARDLFAATSTQGRLDAGAIGDGAVQSGLAPERASAMVESWLRGTDGDVTIGLADGAGTIPFWTNGTAAVAAAGNRERYPIDLDAAEGAGPGW